MEFSYTPSPLLELYMIQKAHFRAARPLRLIQPLIHLHPPLAFSKARSRRLEILRRKRVILKKCVSSAA